MKLLFVGRPCIDLDSWPPPPAVYAVPRPGECIQVPALCLFHAAPPFLPNAIHIYLQSMVLRAFRDLESTRLEVGGDEGKFMPAVKAAAPICCALPAGAMDALTRQIPAVWALRQ